MTPTGIVGNLILISALTTIIALEARRRRRRATRQRDAALAALGKAYVVRHDRDGQALVELALILPFALFALLGAVESGFLFAEKLSQDHSTEVIAQWAAEHPGESWHAVANHEGFQDCDVDVVTPGPPDLLEARVTCFYEPRVTVGLWDGLAISSSASAATAPEPTPTPSPSPTDSPEPSGAEA